MPIDAANLPKIPDDRDDIFATDPDTSLERTCVNVKLVSIPIILDDKFASCLLHFHHVAAPFIKFFKNTRGLAIPPCHVNFARTSELARRCAFLSLCGQPWAGQTVQIDGLCDGLTALRAYWQSEENGQ